MQQSNTAGTLSCVCSKNEGRHDQDIMANRVQWRICHFMCEVDHKLVLLYDQTFGTKYHYSVVVCRLRGRIACCGDVQLTVLNQNQQHKCLSISAKKPECLWTSTLNWSALNTSQIHTTNNQECLLKLQDRNPNVLTVKTKHFKSGS